jgi:peroxiredoxin
MSQSVARRTGWSAMLLVAASWLGQPVPGEESRPDAPSRFGQRVSHFVLPDTAGEPVGLSDFEQAEYLIVVFLGTECPIGNSFVPVLLELQQQYADQGVKLIGVNANPGDTAEKIAAHRQEYGITFPMLIDTEQSVRQLFAAQRTPEVFLLDGRRVVRYRGRIDDRFGYTYKRDEPQRHDLKEALDELLAGKTVSVPQAEPAGCLITPRVRPDADMKVTYAQHVAPILRKHCADCHHPGTAAPFSLLTYEDARNWSEMIEEVVIQRRMPPWHADPRYGHFANERRLSQGDVDTLTAWIAAGTPRGDETLEPAAVTYEEGWRIGQPDVVFQMPKEFTVPAKGEVKYQYFTAPSNFTEDMWVQAAEARPGNRSVVHHIIVFYRTKETRQPVWIAATAPGADPLMLPEGSGRRIPAGAELVWQLHYTPTGKEEVDRSELGLVFCKERPKHNVETLGISNHRFRIPPGESHHEVVATSPTARDAVVLAFMPHMHLRGKDFEYQAIYPDGRTETLLSVPQYDFSWQHTYRLAAPLRLPKGTTLRCVAHFDNSAANPANPNAEETVRWGDQTWEEMMIGYVNFYWAEARQ